MFDHLTEEEIAKMPLHLQILHYFEQWGKQSEESE